MMAEMSDAPKRRRFRYSLRTLLIVVTLAAIASWAYWIGWPWWLIQRERWQIQREQARFVESLKNLKAGMTTYQATGTVQRGSHCEVFAVDVGANCTVQQSAGRVYVWPDASYLIRRRTTAIEPVNPESEG